MKWLPVFAGVFICFCLHAQNNRSIYLLKLYSAQNFDTEQLQNELYTNGFDVVESEEIPDAAGLADSLSRFGQFWIVSDYKQHLDSSHIPVIRQFLDSGNSMYILADNEPYNADANFLSGIFTGAAFKGNYLADISVEPKNPTELSVNVNSMYEGFTVSSITIPESVKPQFVGSDGQVFIATYWYHYKVILDGGFTRMYTKWSPGSAKYFVNAATWLSTR